MISTLLFALATLCFVAELVFSRSSQARPSLETYYVCDPESLPNPSHEAALPALAGDLRG